MRERLRRLFDAVDPMPEIIATPTHDRPERLATLPEEVATRGLESSLSFRHKNFTIHIEIGAVITGIVVPWVPEIAVKWPDGVTWAQVDERGVFEVDDVPRGPVRLVMNNAATDWFVR
jgi:hypothetical protein